MRLGDGIGDARPDDRVVAQRHDHARPVALVDAGQRLDVEMVVVVVRDQHDVDARQVRKGDAGLVDALGADEGQRARTLRIHRVDQQVEARDLVEERGVAEMDDANPFDTGRWPVLRRGRVALGESLALALRGLPFQHVGETLGHGPAIGEDDAVEILRHRPLIIGVAGAGDRRPGGACRSEKGGDAKNGQQLATVHGRQGGAPRDTVKPPRLHGRLTAVACSQRVGSPS